MDVGYTNPNIQADPLTYWSSMMTLSSPTAMQPVTMSFVDGVLVAGLDFWSPISAPYKAKDRRKGINNELKIEAGDVDRPIFTQKKGAGRLRSNEKGGFCFPAFAASCAFLPLDDPTSKGYPRDTSTGGTPAEGGIPRSPGRQKLVLALGPRRLRAASSYARAASSAVSKVPSHLRVFFQGSRISAANRPHGRFLTPRKRASLPPPPPIARTQARRRL
ncbi:hypothetical protein B296_00027698 [Ensete ventricosum]|uniref:Uncharacterized protein n=1 Tax=Ensete ventricosum TaxID=4639 RepID=A0A427APA2_ENSVE|nr:hypothetical protein B296_00027698 [Ensete ventricosum]